MLNSIWIELHQEMPRHPKALALAQALKVSRREAVGILIDLWTWGLSCADEDGGLKSIGDEDRPRSGLAYQKGRAPGSGVCAMRLAG